MASEPRVGRWYKFGTDWLRLEAVGKRFATLAKPRGQERKGWPSTRTYLPLDDLAALPTADERPEA